MPIIVSPGQFSRRAELYYQLAQLLAAGITLTAALQQLQQRPPARSYREPLRRVLAAIEEGYNFAESLRLAGDWLPQFDLALLDSGEKSGRLDASLRLLSNYYTDRAQTVRQMLGALIYPLFIFHFAIFLFPFPTLFITGNVGAYAQQTLTVLIPFYLLVGLGVYVTQSSHGERWRASVEAVLNRLPVIGTARRSLALSRLAAALEGLISAGVSIVEGWELAANASGSPALRRVVLGWRPLVDAGRTPAEVMRESRAFPEIFASQYATGEVSGKLDDVLQRLHRYYQEEGSRKLHAVAAWAPRLFYFAVVLMVAYRIVSFYSNYFNHMLDPAKF
jgi:type II secretory pathway component PulF